VAIQERLHGAKTSQKTRITSQPAAFNASFLDGKVLISGADPRRHTRQLGERLFAAWGVSNLTHPKVSMC
jgi:hypothetical protein